MPRHFFPRFRSLLLKQGSGALEGSGTIIGREGHLEIRYTPFEHANRDARLVIVGITPGNTQLALAYDEVRKQLCAGLSEDEVLRAVKSIAAFGGDSMRPNLCRMLRHFKIDRMLGISDPEHLWTSSRQLLHATSVVPHAAFKRGRMFAGSFEEVMRSALLRNCFSEDFVDSLREINPEALYVGLGPTPDAALKWCVSQGYLRADQVLGSFAHPSTSGGSQVSYYLREKARSELKPGDPVLRRCDWLDQAYFEIRDNVAARGRDRGSGRPGSESGERKLPMSKPASKPPPDDERATENTERLDGLWYVVKRGKGAGTILRPHVHEDGCHVVSPTRFERDYVRLQADEPIAPWLKDGYKLRMSDPKDPKRPPSLIGLDSIEGSDG